MNSIQTESATLSTHRIQTSEIARILQKWISKNYYRLIISWVYFDPIQPDSHRTVSAKLFMYLETQIQLLT